MEIKRPPSFHVEQLLHVDTWHQVLSFQYFQHEHVKKATTNNTNTNLSKELTFSFQHGPAQIRRGFFSTLSNGQQASASAV